LTIGDVKKVRDLLVSTVNDYKQLLRFRRSEGKDQFDNESYDPANTDFNSAKYLFVSFRLAERFPDTRESRVISAFSTPFPTVAYGSTRELSVSYNRKFDGFKSSISMILLYFVGSFSALPNPMQDGMLHSALSTSCGYIMMGFLRLYEMSNPLVSVPCAVVLLILVFAYYMKRRHDRKGKQKLQKIVPAVPTEDPKPVVSSTGVIVGGGGGGGRAGRADFKGRRQSIEAGRQLVRELQAAIETTDRSGFQADQDKPRAKLVSPQRPHRTSVLRSRDPIDPYEELYHYEREQAVSSASEDESDRDCTHEHTTLPVLQETENEEETVIGDDRGGGGGGGGGGEVGNTDGVEHDKEMACRPISPNKDIERIGVNVVDVPAINPDLDSQSDTNPDLDSQSANPDLDSQSANLLADVTVSA